ncbi:pitrilysin family protein [Lacinutrix sp. Bg11-31]|uniref:M16 family metallopeptidase n=1 Tax=Lacinutrix sp. Bg11-31 TaxID=2057808 RepID=UPI000C31B42D|nr:pitrilysin family protein [Lacinutrix sp. Bg11-31]AUC80890.1 insulinase family protein [Lacinutrix sp. Bg11-31]
MKNINQILKKSLTLILLLVFSFTVQSQIKKTASVEGITEYMLDNGLKVLLFPDNSAQTITVNITYRVGSRHEGYGEKGMAHLLEHLVFKGTPNHPNIPEELTSHGARPNGTTWYDRTNYFETFNATEENLDWALDLESDRMLNSFIAEKDLQSEFSVVRNEFEMSENSPSSVLVDKVISSAYLWHNYGQSTIGNRSDIERVPIENLKAFYKKYYRPDNAVLMVTGKFEEANMLAKVVKKFGVLKNSGAPLKDVPTIEPAQDGEKRVTLSRVGDLQIVSALYHTPAVSHEDYAAIAVAELILADEPSGRLYKALVNEKKASSLWSFSPFTKEPGFMYINVDVPSDKSLTEAETTLLSLLDNLGNNPVTETEVNRGKTKFLKQADDVFRDSARFGTFMSEFIGAGDWRLAFVLRDRVENMTADKVNAAIQRYLIKTNRTVGLFIPEEKPMRVSIEHTEGIEALVTNYKGKESMGAGDVFNVSFDNIQSTLNTGTLSSSPIAYGFIKKNNRGKTVTVSFTSRTGNVNDLMNKGLAASYTAKMLNKGTKSKSRQAIEDKLSAIKSSISFSGSNGKITANLTSTEENLTEALSLMVDMLKNPLFDATELDKLKTEDLAAIEQNKTDPQFLAIREMGLLNQYYKKGHPLYNWTIDEEVAAINAVSVKELQAYYNNFYGISNNATLVAIGNIDEQALKSYFDNAFKDFKSNLPYTVISDKHQKNKSANQKIKTPDKKNAISFGTLPIETSKYDDDYAALQMAGEILGGGFISSRIANRLRQQDGVSYGAGARVNVDNNKNDNNSAAMVYAIYAPENAEKVQLGFREEIARFIKDGITQEELKTAVDGWIQGQSVARAKDNELSGVISNNMYYDRDLSFQQNIEAKVSSLTVADVNKAIKKHFKTFDEWTVVNAGDFENFEIKKEAKKVD